MVALAVAVEVREGVVGVRVEIKVKVECRRSFAAASIAGRRLLRRLVAQALLLLLVELKMVLVLVVLLVLVVKLLL